MWKDFFIWIAFEELFDFTSLYFKVLFYRAEKEGFYSVYWVMQELIFVMAYFGFTPLN